MLITICHYLIMYPQKYLYTNKGSNFIRSYPLFLLRIIEWKILRKIFKNKNLQNNDLKKSEWSLVYNRRILIIITIICISTHRKMHTIYPIRYIVIINICNHIIIIITIRIRFFTCSRYWYT